MVGIHPDETSDLEMRTARSRYRRQATGISALLPGRPGSRDMSFPRKRESTAPNTTQRPVRMPSPASSGLGIEGLEGGCLPVRIRISLHRNPFVIKVFPLRYDTVTIWQTFRNRLRVRFRLNRAPADGTVPPSRFHRSGRSFFMGYSPIVHQDVDVVYTFVNVMG